jgi:hypothetical protein
MKYLNLILIPNNSSFWRQNANITEIVALILSDINSIVYCKIDLLYISYFIFTGNRNKKGSKTRKQTGKYIKTKWGLFFS